MKTSKAQYAQRYSFLWTLTLIALASLGFAWLWGPSLLHSLKEALSFLQR